MRIARFVLLLVACLALPGWAAPRRARVTVDRGGVLVGELVSADVDEVVVIVEGVERRYPRARVRSVEVLDSAGATAAASPHARPPAPSRSPRHWAWDPEGTRTFYAPTARMRARGEVVLSQRELVFTELELGITDHLSVEAGVMWPLFNDLAGGPVALGALKVGAPVGRDVSLAAEVRAGAVGPLRLGGLLASGVVTFGAPRASVTFSAGKPLVFADSALGRVEALFTFAGQLELRPHVRLLTEHWVQPDFRAGSYSSLDAVGVRLFGEQLAVDVGAVWALARPGQAFSPVPWPWLAVSWRTGS